MDTLSFNRTSKHRINDIISKKYGGRYSKSEAFGIGGIGIGGLALFENDDLSNPFMKVNFELLKEGLAIYYRNIDENNITLFSFDEISEISLCKEAHILNRKNISIFRKMLHLGFDFYTAKMFLLENEIIAEYKPELIIKTKNYIDTKLFVLRKSPQPISAFLLKMNSNIKVTVDLAEFEYI